MGYVAKCNFMAGKGLSFKKGEPVVCDDETADRLLSEGLIDGIPDSEAPPAEKETNRGAVRELESVEPPSPESKKGRKKKG